MSIYSKFSKLRNLTNFACLDAKLLFTEVCSFVSHDRNSGTTKHSCCSAVVVVGKGYVIRIRVRIMR